MRKKRFYYKVGYFSQFLLVNAVLVLLIMVILASVAFSLVQRQVIEGLVRESEKTFGILYSEFEGVHESFLAVIYNLYATGSIEVLLKAMEPQHEEQLLIEPQQRQQLFHILDKSAGADSSISMILLYNRGSGNRYVYDKHGRIFTSVDEQFPFFKELANKEQPKVTIGSRIVNLENRQEECFALGGNLGLRNLSDPPVYIAVCFTSNLFMESIQALRSDFPVYYAIYMDDDKLFSSPGGFNNIRSQKDRALQITTQFHDENRNMYYISAMDRDVIRMNNLHSFFPIALGLFFVTLLFFIIYGITIHTTNNRMQELLQAMNKLGKSDLSARIPVRGTADEFDKIAIHFNKMSSELNEYITRAYIFELEKKNAELGELQSRISPHFLSNTIDSLRRMINQGQLGEADEMMVMLARFYRLMVMKKTFITIGEEIGTVRLYLDMMSIRYSDSFTYQIHVRNKLRAAGIIRNILQPLVENYFIHGYDSNRSDNHMDITCSIQDDRITIHISDNGRGIDAEVLQVVKSSIHSRDPGDTNHYGLASVFERLRLMYGSESSVELISDEHCAFSLCLEFPILTIRELEERISTIQK